MGALNDNTSHHDLTGVGAPTNFVIQDLGAPLSDDTGLFVYTMQPGEAGNSYYAVTEVVNGVETQTLSTGINSLTSPLIETVAAPQPVLVSQVNGGGGRVYTSSWITQTGTRRLKVMHTITAWPFRSTITQTWHGQCV
jgi:hypothetical protein